MSTDGNIEIVRSCYEMFRKGDAAGILTALSDDVDWGVETTTNVAPWYGLRRGKTEVGAFFQAFGATMDVEDFTPLVYAASGDDVLTVVRCHARHRASGRAVRMNLHHHFTLRYGLIVHYRGTEDTAQVAAAIQSPAQF
ncbi:nuclear transport factor 2 family protein [Streptacidiphilus anmyonensis]|uniref:nuclear transport factor 2 family protein n=1 Tax=Streptacidiphilus anmyonensis TaxID=405782 RepID=UPI0005A71925|nr:nuclear transport factor 2 family protein [Streptacidiphilus anmyonensis]